MTEIKMGLKHVILQRMQQTETFDRPINTDRRITDFSIKRILEDLPEKKKDNLMKWYPAGSKFHNYDILDLSKSALNNTNFLISCASRNWECAKSIRGNYAMPPPPIPSLLSATDLLVKPKVLKYNNACNGCADCDLYLKKVNYYQQYYFYQQQQHNSLLKKDLLMNYCGAAGSDNWISSSLPKSNDQRKQQQNVVQTSLAAAVQTTINLIKKPDSTKLKVKTNLCDANENLIIFGGDIDEFSFRCQICDKVFGCSDTLQTHEKTHKSPRYECIDCGKGFSQLRNYKYHVSVHRGTKEFSAECTECGKTFNDKGYLSSHMKIHRNKKEYECPYCPKSFNQRVAFNMHVRIHTGVKPHKCSECGKRFSRKMLLKQHQRTHSGEKPYTCSVCGKAFADRSNMTLHHRLHSGIKPFSCPICPKAFTKKHHLKTHLNYHTGCKPYICPHPNCNQAFTQSSNMRTHAKKCQFKQPDSVI